MNEKEKKRTGLSRAIRLPGLLIKKIFRIRKIPPLAQMVYEFVSKNDKVLDLGCGIGNFTKYLKCDFIIGVDAFDYSKQYPAVMLKAELPHCLNIFTDKSFDVILALDLIEHLTKDDGKILLEECERISKRVIFLNTPKEWCDNRIHVEDPRYWSYGNEFNLHRSLWTEEEFIERNYSLQKGFDEETIFAIKYL
ncbi:MAG: class I SAM-dependent methyltransferase [Candidatus Heimdallarchaeota archaeon]